MFRLKSKLAMFAGLSIIALSAEAQQSPVARLDPASAATLFAMRPSAAAADLSPDGTKVIYLAAGPNSETQVRLLDTATGKKIGLLALSGRPDTIYHCEFADNRFAICSLGGNVYHLTKLLSVRRSVLLDTETGKTTLLSVKDTKSINQFDGFVVDWLPDETGAVLMQRHYPDDRGNGVDRVQLDPLKFRSVETYSPVIDRFYTDGHGAVRFTREDETDVGGLLTGKQIYRYRANGSRTWKIFPTSEDFAPVLIERDTDSLYYLDKLDGRYALYRVKLDGVSKPVLMAKHDQVDIDGAIRIIPGGPVVGYQFTDDMTRSVYTDPEYSKLHAGLSKALTGAPLVQFAGSSRDGRKMLIFASGDRDPGAFYLLDRNTMKLEALLEARQALAGIPLGVVKPVNISTRDGKTIPGYVTMPPGGAQTNLPVVVMPHGGPSARDEWGFDWLAQYLASLGYAVIQPNFRGSSGYGDDFEGENAFKGWRLAMSDIADSADWAIKTGLADRSRLAIVGWSYGGYAALQSATLDPRYKAVVAIAPVTDLAALRRDSEGYTNVDLAKDMIGKGAHLKEGSPSQHASAINAPVLLFHGDLDVNVRISQSVRMEQALREAGKKVEFVRFENLDHSIVDSDARKVMLTKIGDLLKRTIG